MQISQSMTSAVGGVSDLQVKVFQGAQLPPNGPDPGSAECRGDGHPVHLIRGPLTVKSAVTIDS